ncbi:DNA recombination protein RmuC [Fimbriimonas ginsengisoli]|uniref:DNA recombination protein RmuC n=1 Tax=Fimbriimonas ginsengisoli Gsoil 348 TaxID=661478 RepID=A0A068NP17_FIMGI|nr:DNA recombination protein RmuC [Fimbriimonas ginsengisoli]AIE85181.1 DNA recombination protein RmuC [Fimbriimonas ginsengisoli Gsoil 348]
MSTSDLLIGLILGGAIGAVLSWLAHRPKSKALDSEREKNEALHRDLRTTAETAARLQGEGVAMQTLREQLETKEDELQAYIQRTTSLTGQLSEAKKEAEEVRAARRDALAEKDREVERLLAERERAMAEKFKLLEEAEKALSEKFGAVSVQSLKSATEEFLKLATERFDKKDEAADADLEKRQREIDGMLKPIADTLEKMERQHKEMEERRVSAFDAIEKGIRTLSEEADQLANALRKPNSRGAWGEMQLQVILENAGLQEGEHFVLQHSTEGEEGRLRTDVVIRLPKGRLLVIDSKAPLETYWEGMNAPDEATRVAKFASHARLVREHVKKLSNKSYWGRYDSSPDCVVMFIPTEGAYQAAFEADRSLLADAHQGRVYVANPMTLISMVHVAAYVLNEERLRENALEVRATGAELYKRLAKFVGDLDDLGRHLRLSVQDFNRAIGSLDGRVLPQARRMSALGAGSGGDIPSPEPVESLPRLVSSPEALDLPLPLESVDQ